MIEVYKTYVRTRKQASKIIELLKNTFSGASINFDLQDCDKILRVEGIEQMETVHVINDLLQLGFKCEILA